MARSNSKQKASSTTTLFSAAAVLSIVGIGVPAIGAFTTFWEYDSAVAYPDASSYSTWKSARVSGTPPTWTNQEDYTALSGAYDVMRMPPDQGPVEWETGDDRILARLTSSTDDHIQFMPQRLNESAFVSNRFQLNYEFEYSFEVTVETDGTLADADWPSGTEWLFVHQLHHIQQHNPGLALGIHYDGSDLKWRLYWRWGDASIVSQTSEALGDFTPGETYTVYIDYQPDESPYGYCDVDIYDDSSNYVGGKSWTSTTTVMTHNSSGDELASTEKAPQVFFGLYCAGGWQDDLGGVKIEGRYDNIVMKTDH